MILKLTSLLLSYLIGSIPTGYWVGKIFYKTDIREFGSKNVGATNTVRVLGWIPGISVLIFDIFKGYLAAAFISKIGSAEYNFQVLCGLFAILGHSFTIFLKFKGGKGVATSVGVFLFLCPIALSISFLIFAFTVWQTGFISAGSIISACIFPLLAFYEKENNFLFVIAVLLAVFIIFKHRTNIKRILKGEETSIFKK